MVESVLDKLGLLGTPRKWATARVHVGTRLSSGARWAASPAAAAWAYTAKVVARAGLSWARLPCSVGCRLGREPS